MKPLLSIQYLRAFAALGVVVFHSERATILGQAGVDVFFVISGFIMWMVTAKPISPVEFLWHRVLRIVPMYWIATLIMAAHLRSPTADIIRSLLFWPYANAGGKVWPVLVQGWTLNFEMFFYLLFALALILPRRFQLPTLTAVLCGLAGVGIAFVPEGALSHTYTNPLLIEFLAGAWLSEMVQRGKYPGFKTALGMLAVGLACFLISLRAPTPELWRFVVWGGPSLLVVCAAVSIELCRGVPAIKWLKALGDGSYSIYLFHPFVLKTVENPLMRFPALIPVVAVGAAGAAVGVAAFYTLEQPITTWLRRRARRVALVPVVEKIPVSRLPS